MTRRRNNRRSNRRSNLHYEVPLRYSKDVSGTGTIDLILPVAFAGNSFKAKSVRATYASVEPCSWNVVFYASPRVRNISKAGAPTLTCGNTVRRSYYNTTSVPTEWAQNPIAAVTYNGKGRVELILTIVGSDWEEGSVPGAGRAANISLLPLGHHSSQEVASHNLENTTVQEDDFLNLVTEVEVLRNRVARMCDEC